MPAVLLGAALAACSDQGAGDDATDGGTEQQFPDVLEAELTADGDQFMIAVTVGVPR